MIAMKNLRIGTRLGVAFALVVLLMTALAVAARLGLANARADMDTALHDRYAKVKILTGISDDLNLHARIMRNLIIMDSQAQRGQEIKKLEESREHASKAYEDLRSRLSRPEGRAMFEKVQQERTGFVAEENQFVKLVQAGDVAAAKTLLLETLRPRQLSYQKRLRELADYQEGLMNDAGEDTMATVDRVTTLLIGGTLLGLALAIAAGVIVTRSVTRPVAAVVAALKTVANGDLTVDVVTDRGDELGELQRALSSTVTGLRRVVSDVRAGVDSVSTASNQIAAGNQDLSSRTEQQASSLQETASSMEQLTATVRQSADTARAASNLAANARVAAGHGGEVVSQVVGTMDEISASSRKIVEIIGTIDGIAFQTNILALNAAVEAARAGEQGRGFAVVASEVRVLAQRSAEAAKEIKALIGNSADKVEAGSRQVAEAGQAMQDIVAQVGKVNDLIGEIASTADEQSRGIAQVNTAVTQMDQVTQQNAALVEESAAAASSLAQQAQTLAEAVATFRLETTVSSAKPAEPVKLAPVPTAVKAALPPPEPRAASPRPATPAPARRAAAVREDELAWESF
ncbi:methyl-accepting chemotaxis protein [Roseateles saccharophilus]|uniref:Methyl-accepting chemotaxis protein n=1 Tax=Roseateles saccharophilus TaxID=304 RepID=A0A4R3UK65_ROSSA|nr:methyl-accepting chemotaxis protein [Roseateles saccharophilus]MDG0834340.1 HAMP domain-containing protein [Roseateles saccharophilus]TCU90703.1 methyl-accepting chemotaxis protein [Roseateles saccharophilus]